MRGFNISPVQQIQPHNTKNAIEQIFYERIASISQRVNKKTNKEKGTEQTKRRIDFMSSNRSSNSILL